MANDDKSEDVEMSRGERCMIALSLVFVCLVYIFDVTSDFVLTLTYVKLGHHWSGVVSFIPAALASLLSVVLSVAWYSNYTQRDTESLQLSFHARFLNHASKPWRWIYRTVIYFLNASPLASYLVVLRLVLSGSSKSKIDDVRRHADYTRMFHCMYQAVPQIVLQTTMLFTVHPAKEEAATLPKLELRYASILSSLLSIVLALYFYHKNVETKTFRKNGHQADPNSGVHFWLRYFWHLGFLISRMLVMSCLLTLCVIAFVSHEAKSQSHHYEGPNVTITVQDNNNTEVHANSTVPVIRHSAGVHYWPLLALLGCILVQWLIFSCLLHRNEDTTYPIHLAKAGTYVWVALSQEHPSHGVAHPLHFGLELAALLLTSFIAIIFAVYFTLFAAIFANTWVSVVFTVLSAVFVPIFVTVLSVMLFSFIFASICKIISFCVFSPPAESLQLEMS